MDARQKRNLAEAVRRRLTSRLSRLSFQRTKTSFWTRERPFVIELIHLHLFTFAPAFRVHLGIRVLNDSFEAPALNGLATNDGWYGTSHRVSLEYSEEQHSVEQCADNVMRFISEVGVPWFDRFAAHDQLLNADDSPLQAAERAALAEALAGKHDEARVTASRRILGLTD